LMVRLIDKLIQLIILLDSAADLSASCYWS
jgi:hypothetical protein